MHKLTINTEFLIKRKETAVYVQKLYDDLHALIECANSESHSTLVELVEKAVD